MVIRKAILTAAGFGSRMLPVTKVIQKELLPVLTKPVIDYIVDDCIKAGITEFIVVVNNKDNQIADYYSSNDQLNTYLLGKEKDTIFQNLKELERKAKFVFVEQTPSDPYGTATPVRLAQKYVEHEDAFLVFMGDDFIYNKDGSSEAKKMIEAFSSGKSSGLATFLPIAQSEVGRYGVAKYTKIDNVKKLESIVEKPNPDSAPSNLINISKYIFTNEIFDVIHRQEIDLDHNELLITDSVSMLARQNDVLLYETSGAFLDCGNVGSWLETNIRLAMNDPDLKQHVLNAVSQSRENTTSEV